MYRTWRRIRSSTRQPFRARRRQGLDALGEPTIRRWCRLRGKGLWWVRWFRAYREKVMQVHIAFLDRKWIDRRPVKCLWTRMIEVVKHEDINRSHNYQLPLRQECIVPIWWQALLKLMIITLDEDNQLSEEGLVNKKTEPPSTSPRCKSTSGHGNWLMLREKWRSDTIHPWQCSIWANMRIYAMALESKLITVNCKACHKHRIGIQNRSW